MWVWVAGRGAFFSKFKKRYLRQEGHMDIQGVPLPHPLKSPAIPPKGCSYSGLCSSRAWWPLAPNFCPRATRKSQIFHTNHTLGTLDFTDSEDWPPFNFPQSTALLFNAKFMMMYPHQRDIIQNKTKTCSSLCQGLLNFLRNLQNLKFAFKLFIILNRQHIISQNLEITS